MGCNSVYYNGNLLNIVYVIIFVIPRIIIFSVLKCPIDFFYSYYFILTSDTVIFVMIISYGYSDCKEFL